MIATALRHSKKRRQHEIRAAALKRATTRRDAPGSLVEYDQTMFGGNISAMYGPQSIAYLRGIGYLR